MNEPLPIRGDDLWVKVVDMLQQNWAAIDSAELEGVRVYFISDAGDVFDEIAFDSEAQAIAGLMRNGFRRLAARRTFNLSCALLSRLFGPDAIPMGRSIRRVGTGDDKYPRPAGGEPHRRRRRQDPSARRLPP